MRFDVTKGTVSYRPPHWRGFVRWRAYDDDATDEEIRAVPQKRKAFNLTEYNGRPINAPTEKRPNLGRDTAEKALAVARAAFIEELERRAREEDPDEADVRRFVEEYDAGGAPAPRIGLNAEKMSWLTVPDFVSLVIDGLADGSIQREGRELAYDTVKNYESLNRNKITPYFGDTRVRDLDVMAINSWKSDMSRRERAGERGFGRSTRRKAYNLLKQAFAFAQAWEVIVRNPFDRTGSIAPAKPSPNPLDRESVGKLVAAADGMPLSRMTVALKLAMEASLRLGESCALKWSDIDLGAPELRVWHSIASTGAGEVDRPFPKSDAGNRTVPLTADLADTLSAWRDRQSADCLAYGRDFSAGDYVLGNANGGFMQKSDLSRRWTALSEALGLKGTRGRTPTYHDLRHTFVTLALAAGADVKSVSTMAGHASAAMTLDVYADSMPEAKRAAIDKAASALWPEPGKG